MTHSPEVSFRISNRHFVSRLIEWGAFIEKRRGEDVLMIGPPPGSVPFKVKAPEARSRNSSTMTWHALEAVGADSWQDFMERKREDMPKIGSLKEPPVPKQPPVQPQPAQEATQVRDPNPPDPSKPYITKKGERRAVPHRGTAAKVYDALCESKTPMTLDRIVAVTGLGRQQVHGALYHLTKGSKTIRRVAPSVYALPENVARTDVRIDVRTDNATTDHATEPQEYGPPIVPAGVTTWNNDGTVTWNSVEYPAKDDIKPVVAQVEDMALTVLELLFPDGIPIRVLPTVDAWRTLTARMIDEAKK